MCYGHKDIIYRQNEFIRIFIVLVLMKAPVKHTHTNWLKSGAFWLFLILPLLLFSQRHKIDSLNEVLKTQKADSNRVKTLNHLAAEFYDAGKYDSSIIYADSSAALAQRIGNNKELAWAFHLLGISYDRKDDHNKGMDYHLKAVALYQQLNDKKELAYEYSSLGGDYWNLGDFPSSLQYFLKTMEMQKQLGNKHGIASSLLDMGLIYEELGNTSKARDYYFQSVKMFQELKDDDGVAGNYCNIGNTYADDGKDANALQYYYLSLGMELKLGKQRSIARNYGNMGNVYEDMGNYSQALDFEFKALNIDSKVGYKKGTASKMNTIGSIYRKQKKYTLSKLYLDSSLHVAQRIGVKEYAQNACASLAHLARDMGNYKEALTQYRNCIAYGDSLRNAANTRKIVQAEMNFDFQQKKAAEKAEQDKKDALAQQESKRIVMMRNVFIGGFILMLALAFFIFRGYSQKRHANEIIKSQKSLVEKKQKEIVDSLHYAERIQTALLASEQMLSPSLKNGLASDYFIYHKPKSIVSGDFYWATKKDGRFYFAVCDSTGHGVPGAFMSLLNISFLNEAVSEKNIIQPNEVFNHTRKKLMQNISFEGQQDGMDGVLASLTKSGNNVKLDYAVAYSKPLIIRGSQVIELPGDKMPVGKSPKEDESFTLRSVNLQKGDMLYFFTDGYADQFGGEKGKKFKYAQLIKLLKSICSRTMDEQKAVLENTFEEWRRNLEQVDDVLITGIRI